MADTYTTWQTQRVAYDARSGIARFIPATRSSPTLNAADVAWLRGQLAKRRAYLEMLAERAGLDPVGVMLGDGLEGALRRVDAALAAYGE